MLPLLCHSHQLHPLSPLTPTAARLMVAHRIGHDNDGGNRSKNSDSSTATIIVHTHMTEPTVAVMLATPSKLI